MLTCVQRSEGPTPAGVLPACDRPVGERCTPTPPGGAPCSAANSYGCFRGTDVHIETGGMECASGLCVAYRYDQLSDPTGAARDRLACTCRCDVPEAMRASVDPRTLCACGAGFACQPVLGVEAGPGLAGSYCVRSAFVP